MEAKKVLKSEVEIKRERCEAAIRRMRERCGDTRSEAEIKADVERMFYYTPEEAERIIAALEEDRNDVVPMENGAELHLVPKKEFIQRIREMTRWPK